jgi:EmrB/QacA subfamily drug resistance transporter
MTTGVERQHYQVTFAVLAAAGAAYALLQSLVVPVLSTIQHDVHTSQATVTWVLTAYLLSASIFTPIMGRLGDMAGKKRIFVISMLALALGSLLAAVATNVDVLIVARVIQGVGGGVLPVSFGIIRDEFPHDKVAGAVGIIASLLAVGAGLGIVLAGPIVDVLDYHWLFWIPMIITVAAAGAAVVVIPESPVRSAGRISWAPAVLLSAWLVALLVALSEASTWGWGSGKVLGLFGASLVLAVAWVRVELRAAAPLIDMQMMRLPAVWTTNAVALLIGVALYSVFVFLPEFVQTPSSAGYGFGASITASGLILLPMSVTMFAAGFACGPLIRRWGGKAVTVAGSSVSVVSLLLLTFAHTQRWELFLATGIMGVGFGLAFSAMSALIVAAVPRAQTGVASGMNANIRTIGGSIGAALMTSFVTSHPQASGLPRESGYTHGFLMLLIAIALSVVVGLRTRSGAAPGPDPQPDHPELAVLAAGTVVGDEPE